MIHRWEIRVMTPSKEWVQTYQTRLRAHQAFHNRLRISPVGAEIYMYDLEACALIKMRVKE